MNHAQPPLPGHRRQPRGPRRLGLVPNNTVTLSRSTRWAMLFRAKFCTGSCPNSTPRQTPSSMDNANPSKTPAPSPGAAPTRCALAGLGSVFAKGSVVGPDAVLDYLAAYTQPPVAVTNSHLLPRAHRRPLRPCTSKGTPEASRLQSPDPDRRRVSFRRFLCLHCSARGFTEIRHFHSLQQQTAAASACPMPGGRSGHLAPALCPRADPTPRPAPAHLPALQGTDVRCIGRVERSGQIRLFTLPGSPGGLPLHRYLMSPRPSNPSPVRPQPPCHLSLATVTPRLCLQVPLPAPGPLPGGRSARPPTAHDSGSDQPTAPCAGRHDLGESKHLLLLLVTSPRNLTAGFVQPRGASSTPG